MIDVKRVAEKLGQEGKNSEVGDRSKKAGSRKIL